MTFGMSFRAIAIVLAVGVLAGCRSSASLTVSLVSDWVVGAEVSSARTTVTSTGASRMPQVTTRPLRPDAPLTTERVVADIADLRTGTYDVLVELIDDAGATIGDRRATVRISAGANTVHLSIVRSCDGVICPRATDDPSATECVAGRCEAPTCTGPTCGTTGACVANADCPAPTADCAIPVCSDGLCLQAAVLGACPDGSVCVPDSGCEPVTMTGCDPATDPTCDCPPGDPSCACAPGDPSCCDAATDPLCTVTCAPGDPSCCDPATDPRCTAECAPGDPSCCDPAIDRSCPCPPGDPSCCDPTTDPMCCDPAVSSCCQPGDGDCDGDPPPDDCDDTNPFIGSGMEDLCDDGIDQDCDGADLPCDGFTGDCEVDADGDGCCAGEDDTNDADPTDCEGIDSDDDGATDDEEITSCDDPSAPVSSFIGPEAVDYCGDGIDEDCSGSDAPLATCAGRYAMPCAAHGACLDSPHEHLACTRAHGQRTRSCLRCCVECANQRRFHWVNVDHDCARAAERYCGRHGRGGLRSAPDLDPIQWGTCNR